ncbi:MAG TPA: aminodeoxychorismate/anthranilate synthase component II [Bacteroidota bacterium]|nr:aminodeoxychorismate/anthranilate synthase component II [Bacteroidota bacterium]
MVLVIDNYDSFTYNLVQLIGRISPSIEVRRNDEVSLEEIASLAPSHIVLSPGPGRPEDAGITVGLVNRFAPSIPILGVCLGHQAIGVAFGGKVVHAPSLMHGRTSSIHHAGDRLFRGVMNPCTATRYHSLVISPEGFPGELERIAQTSDGVIMAVRHRTHPTVGVQFHPESILTEEGETMIRNWMEVSS